MLLDQCFPLVARVFIVNEDAAPSDLRLTRGMQPASRAALKKLDRVHDR
jgi:hypothetical protein